ncbi:MAG: hypothetical protein H6830_06105 [Planctomycetes bacterium]|nr:hypothetical protein [Planctomycetota bacterium]MCB9909094.1 hypothetical protein [Planctomycetota bacterium]MCB9911656.1 hypothetical protein [Planctomycetota bacterium]HPF14219.1 hypothetical protein [Planctomycetota bacterium]HRV81748.1 hypothetical protein [Planctomycetota bacterium]
MSWILVVPSFVSQPVVPQPVVPQPVPTATAQTADTTRPSLAQTTVGMRVRLPGVPLPGTLLQAVEVHDPGKADALLRVVDAEPQGDGFLYEFEFTPYVPGSHDLRDYLERVDHSSMGNVPSLTVVATAVLPMGRMEPNKVVAERPGRLGGYRDQMVLAGILWVLGLFLIFYLGHRNRQQAAQRGAKEATTLAQKLTPLVERAQRGELDDAERASLERLLFAYWRERRGLHGLRMPVALAQLHEDPEAGPLLRQLEVWLHSPGAGSGSVDVAKLLEPYLHAPENYAPMLGETLAGEGA